MDSPRHTLVRPDPRDVIQAFSAERDPVKKARIYGQDLRPRIESGEPLPLEASNSLGTTSADVVSQRVLDLLVEQVPWVGRISTNISSQAHRFGSAINVDLVSVPAVGTYDGTSGYGSQPAESVSIPVTLNQHKHVQHEFNANEMSGSSVDLLKRHSPAMAEALAADLAQYLYQLITAANFTEAPTVCTQPNFTRIAVLGMDGALTARKVPKTDRTLLLSPGYHSQLFQDDSVVALATFQQSEILTQGKLPMLHNFGIFEAVSLPATGNLAGFGLSPSALAFASRVPADYANAFPGLQSGAASSMIVEPRTGIAMHKVIFVDHKFGKMFMRLAWMFGAAVGDQRCGQRLVSSVS